MLLPCIIVCVFNKWNEPAWIDAADQCAAYHENIGFDFWWLRLVFPGFGPVLIFPFHINCWHLLIGVTITQGNLCPRFCRYKSDFRTQNYKSRVSQEKKPTEECPAYKICSYKSLRVLQPMLFFVFFFEIALNFHNTFVGPCSHVGW